MKSYSLVLVLMIFMLGIAYMPCNVQGQQTKWTFMIYLDADNNLENVGIDNFLDMAKVGSTDDVKIVVQFDRANGQDTRYDDWTTTKRFLVANNMEPSIDNALQDIGEQNMADPTTLFSFVQWAVATYPADHYFLDLWDHGLGWEGIAVDDLPVPNDVMSAIELESALSQITNYIGRPLDIMANDACRMTLEIMYQARPYVDYFVGSEKDEPLEGWPYDKVLGALVADPTMMPVEIGQILVDEYVDSYRTDSRYSVTMALVDSSSLPQLVSSLNNLVTAVNFTLPFNRDSIVEARNQSEHYESNQCVLPMAGNDYDLYDVASQLAKHVDSGRVVEAAASLQLAINRTVIYEQHMDLEDTLGIKPDNCVRARNAHGLSLWYPWDMGPKMGAYEQLDLSIDSLWDEHLRTYRNWSNDWASLSSSLTGEDLDLDGIIDNALLEFKSSVPGSVYIDAYLGIARISSGMIEVLGNVSYQKDVALPSAGVYNFHISLHLPRGMINATSYWNFVVEAPLQIRGFVRDNAGNKLDGVTVTLHNKRTNQTFTTSTVQGHYDFNVTYPTWLVLGDEVVIEASKDGIVVSREFVYQHTLMKVYWFDLYLGSGNSVNGGSTLFGDYWPLLYIPLIGLVVESIFIVLLIRKNKTLRKELSEK